LSKFIIDDAIYLEKEDIPDIQEPSEEELGSLFEIQLHEKYLAKVILKKQGFKDNEIFFERRFMGYQPDILAEKDNKIIIVECCSCKISKIADFLSEADEIWVITRGMPTWEKINYLKERMELFTFKKGVNWNKVEDFRNEQLEQLKKVKSPLDRL
jgi:hypothetical protein